MGVVVNARDNFVFTQRKDEDYTREMSMFPEESENNSFGNDKTVGPRDLNNLSYPSRHATVEMSTTRANRSIPFWKSLPE